MLVLHVGPHKTATTWLQHNFYHNRKALEAQGWLYPETGVRVRVAHHDISDNPDQVLAPKSAKVRELRKIADKAAARGLNVLLSSEGFRHWEPHHIEALRTIMAPHDLHIVYCVRDPVSMLYSFWSQQVRNGMRMSFPDFRDRQFQKAAKSRHLNANVELKALAAIEGARLHVLLYDEIIRRKRDIFDVFVSDILKLPPLPHAEEASANERQQIEMTEFMRLVLSRVGSWKQEAEVNIGRVFHYMLAKRTQKKIVETVAAVTSARHTLGVERDRPILHKIEAALLSRHRHRMLPPPDGDKLFLEGVEQCPYYDENALLADPAVKALVDRTSARFRPGGLRMWVVGWSRFWLSLYRRIMKTVRG